MIDKKRAGAVSSKDAEIARLRAALEKIAAALYDVQWGADVDDVDAMEWTTACPACGSRESDGHDRACLVATALAEAKAALEAQDKKR